MVNPGDRKSPNWAYLISGYYMLLHDITCYIMLLHDIAWLLHVHYMLPRHIQSPDSPKHTTTDPRALFHNSSRFDTFSSARAACGGTHLESLRKPFNEDGTQETFETIYIYIYNM